MPAIIRQQYIEPNEGQSRVRDINIDVEIVRPDDMSQMNAVVQMRADPIHNPHMPNLPLFNPVSVNPSEPLEMLLDGRRTSCISTCLRTRLSEKSEANTFVVDDIKRLCLEKGDPVVVMDCLTEGNTRMYGLVKDFDKNSITIDLLTEPVRFFKGAFIQNLANRWHKASGIIGAKSQLKQPSPPTFRAKRTEFAVEVLISLPLNVGNLKCYDIYVRNHPFNRIEHHWLPDIADVTNNVDRALVESYNGGCEAGGGIIADDQPPILVCTVVGKDKMGQVDVNESIVQPQPLNSLNSPNTLRQHQTMLSKTSPLCCAAT